MECDFPTLLTGYDELQAKCEAENGLTQYTNIQTRKSGRKFPIRSIVGFSEVDGMGLNSHLGIFLRCN